MSKLRKLWILAIPTALVVWLGYTFWTKPFEPFVSPPIGEHRVRASFMIPQGWHGPEQSQVPAARSAANRIPASNATLMAGTLFLVPPGRPNWWPAFLKRLIPPLDPLKNRVHMLILPNSEVNRAVAAFRGGVPAGRFFAAVDSKPLDPKTTMILVFQHEDESTANASLKRALESFRVLQPD